MNKNLFFCLLVIVFSLLFLISQSNGDIVSKLTSSVKNEAVGTYDKTKKDVVNTYNTVVGDITSFGKTIAFDALSWVKAGEKDIVQWGTGIEKCVLNVVPEAKDFATLIKNPDIACSPKQVEKVVTAGLKVASTSIGCLMTAVELAYNDSMKWFEKATNLNGCEAHLMISASIDIIKFIRQEAGCYSKEEKYKKFLSDGADSDTLDRLLKELQGCSDAIANSILKTVVSLTTVAEKNCFKNANNWITNLWQDVASKVQSTNNKTNSALGTLFHDLASWINDINVCKAAIAVKNEAVVVFQHTKQWTSDLETDGHRWLNSLQSLASLFMSGIKQIEGDVVGVYNKAKNAVVNEAMTADQAAKDAINKGKQWITKAEASAKSMILNAENRVKTIEKQAQADAVGLANTAETKAKSWASDAAQRAKVWAQKAESDATSWLSNAEADAKNWINNALNEVKNLFEDAEHFATSAESSVKSWVAHSTGEAEKWASNAENDAKSWVSNAGSEVKGWVSDAKKDVNGWVSSTEASAKNWIDAIGTDSKNAYANARNFISKAENSAKHIATNVEGDIVKGFGDVKNAFECLKK